ncbi:MAG: capsule biosynthesis protein CapA [Pseudomonadota bacterium]
MVKATQRVFLFLQGPHGPFFRTLAQSLKDEGAEVHRVCFNAADEWEWGKVGPRYRFSDTTDAFSDWLEQHLPALGVTDIVLYGDTRPIHRIAMDQARRMGIETHCLEEGYLRPSWVTYERHGNNGNSRLMSLSLPRMAQAMGQGTRPEFEAPATWGDTRQHFWHSVWYHARGLLPSVRYGKTAGHRDMPLWKESAFYVLRALKTPWIRLRRGIQQWLLLRSSKTFHLTLLQLSFDASMQVHSDYESTSEFIEDVIDAFAEGAPAEDYLVLKAHPFEDGRERLGKVIRDLAYDLGVADRVIFIDGGKKLAALLDRARSAITVNSTSAQQALWRGLPVAALGRAIYKKPGLISEQSLTSFMRHPRRPDLRSYWLFRQFMMETSQITGSYYSALGRKRLLQQLPGLMLDQVDPYEKVLSAPAHPDANEAIPRPTLIVAG